MLYNMLCSTFFFLLYNMLYNNKKIYITRYIYPSGTQTHCWDVIYNKFLGYITCYITCKVLYSIFFCLYNGVRPVVGINHTIFFGYEGKNWRHNQLCCSLWRAYITKMVHNRRMLALLHNVIRILTVYHPGAKRRVLSPCTCTFLNWGTKFLTRMWSYVLEF